MSSSIRLNPTVVVVAIFVALLVILTLYMIREGFYERSLKSVSGQLGQTESALRNADDELRAALVTEKNLKNELRTLEQRYTESRQALAEELAQERAANRALKQDVERLKGQHAKSLAAERDRAKQMRAAAEEEHKQQQARTLEAERTRAEQALVAAHEEYQKELAQIEQEAQAALDDARRSSVELEEQLAEAVRKRGSLVEEINALNAELQDTRVQHAEQLKALGDKAAYYRTALEGSEPARSEQLTRLELEVQRLQDALTEAREASQGAKADEVGALREQLSGTEQALQEARALLEEADRQAERSQEGLEGAYAEQTAQSQQEIAALSLRLEDERAMAERALESLRREHAAELAKAAQRMEATERQLAEIQGELETAHQQAEMRRQRAEEEHVQDMEQARGEISALNQLLATQKAEAEQTLEALSEENDAKQARLKSELARAEEELRQARQAHGELERLHSQFAELNGQYTERGMRLTVSESELQFPGGQFALPSTEIESLDRIAAFLQAHKSLNILVEGHTDSGGSDRFNLILSQKRAEAVKQALVQRGVEESRMEATGVGEARPVASNQTYNGRRQNRRVEIYIIEG